VLFLVLSAFCCRLSNEEYTGMRRGGVDDDGGVAAADGGVAAADGPNAKEGGMDAVAVVLGCNGGVLDAFMAGEALTEAGKRGLARVNSCKSHPSSCIISAEDGISLGDSL
jgi:hypothetical protein